MVVRAAKQALGMADDGGEPDEFLYKVLVVGEVRAAAIARGTGLGIWGATRAGLHSQREDYVAVQGRGGAQCSQAVAALRCAFSCATAWLIGGGGAVDGAGGHWEDQSGAAVCAQDLLQQLQVHHW